MAYVAGAMALLGTVMGTGASLASNKANAQAAEQEAQNFEHTAAFQERQFRRSAELEAGKGRAIAAASGVRADTGSPLLAELDFAKQAELEAQNIRRTGAIQAGAKRYEAKLLNRSNLFTGISGGMQALGQSATLLDRFFARPTGKYDNLSYSSRSTARRPYIFNS